MLESLFQRHSSFLRAAPDSFRYFARLQAHAALPDYRREAQTPPPPPLPIFFCAAAAAAEECSTPFCGMRRASCPAHGEMREEERHQVSRCQRPLRIPAYAGAECWALLPAGASAARRYADARLLANEHIFHDTHICLYVCRPPPPVLCFARSLPRFATRFLGAAEATSRRHGCCCRYYAAMPSRVAQHAKLHMPAHGHVLCRRRHCFALLLMTPPANAETAGTRRRERRRCRAVRASANAQHESTAAIHNGTPSASMFHCGT